MWAGFDYPRLDAQLGRRGQWRLWPAALSFACLPHLDQRVNRDDSFECLECKSTVGISRLTGRAAGQHRPFVHLSPHIFHSCLWDVACLHNRLASKRNPFAPVRLSAKLFLHLLCIGVCIRHVKTLAVKISELHDVILIAQRRAIGRKQSERVF